MHLATKLKWFKSKENKIQGVDLVYKCSRSQSDIPDKQVQSVEAPLCHFEDLEDLLLTSWCQILQHIFRGLVESMPLWIRGFFSSR